MGLSIFVAPGSKTAKNDDVVLAIPEALKEKLNEIVDLHNDLGRTADKYRCSFELGCWEEIINLSMVPIAYHWATGMDFKDLMEYAGLDEGSTVRMITRLDELIRKVGSAAKLLNNDEVARICELAEEKIRREIIFIPSLYILKPTR